MAGKIRHFQGFKSGDLTQFLADVVSFPSVYGARRENELGVFAKVSSDRTITSGTLPSSHSVTSHWLHFHFES